MLQPRPGTYWYIQRTDPGRSSHIQALNRASSQVPSGRTTQFQALKRPYKRWVSEDRPTSRQLAVPPNIGFQNIDLLPGTEVSVQPTGSGTSAHFQALNRLSNQRFPGDRHNSRHLTIHPINGSQNFEPLPEIKQSANQLVWNPLPRVRTTVRTTNVSRKRNTLPCT